MAILYFLDIKKQVWSEDVLLCGVIMLWGITIHIISEPVLRFTSLTKEYIIFEAAKSHFGSWLK